MTPEAQRIAIAEACGFVWERGCFGTPLGRKADDVGPYEDLPDYLSDLNAMHEAEKVWERDFEKMQDYYRQLVLICGRLGTDSDVFRATAAQRAEAFLRTIGQWEESP